VRGPSMCVRHFTRLRLADGRLAVSRPPGPVDTLAPLLVAALDEAAMLVATAASPAAARHEAALIITRILVGLAGSAARI
jgi:hypothetical protein